MYRTITAITAIVVITLISGCGANKSKSSGETNLAPAGPPVRQVLIQTIVPYENESRISPNIRSECKINKQLADFIGQYSQNAGIKVSKKKNLKSLDKGNVLIVSITEAVSSGNAWTGHRKYTQIKGRLYKSGKLLASFRGARTSGGGMMAGYKGSCSVLGRTVKTLGKDISKWLQHPVDNARLGDL